MGALPAFFFPDKKLLHAVRFDVFQVLNHTHSVIFFVTVVQALKVFAGEIRALITKLNLFVEKQVTFLFKKSALLVSGSAAGAIRVSYPLFLYRF